MTTISRLFPWERQVVRALTEGNLPLLRQLRVQIESCSASSRETSAAGFYTTLKVGTDAPPLRGARERFCLGDVQADVGGLEGGAGFILWVQSGLVDCLEGYTYDEPWPATPDLGSIRFFPGPERDMPAIQADASRGR